MATDLSLEWALGQPMAAAGTLVNALTIDVEEYFHVSNLERCLPRQSWNQLESRVETSTHQLLDLLASAGVQATFFVLGWVAERQPDLVRRIHDEGHEVASHGYNHELIYRQSQEEFRADVRRSRSILENIIGRPVLAYRAPSFSIVPRSLWALDVLIEEGFTLDSSIYPVHHDRYGMPNALLEPHRIEREVGTIWEFPPPVSRILGCSIPVGGGGYFRLYPYRLTRSLLQSVNAEGRPFAVYLHPWEIDPEQPRFNPGFFRGFRHYVGLGKTETRLSRLLNDFPFGTLTQALNRLTREEVLPTYSFPRAA